MLRLIDGRSLLVAVAISSATLAGAQAPAAPKTGSPVPAETQPVDVVETIVVTGSRIPRLNLTAVSPVTVVRDEEIKLEGVTLTEELLPATCLETGDPLFCGRVHRDPMGSLWLSDEGFVDSRNANIGAFKVRGIDFGANYSAGLGRLGSASMEFLGSRLQEFVIDNGGLSTPRD